MNLNMICLFLLAITSTLIQKQKPYHYDLYDCASRVDGGDVTANIVG